jgi:hypothetical protein
MTAARGTTLMNNHTVQVVNLIRKACKWNLFINSVIHESFHVKSRRIADPFVYFTPERVEAFDCEYQNSRCLVY